MAKVTPISEQFQHWLEDLKEGFWGDLYGQTRLAWKKFFEADSARQRDQYCGAGWHERGSKPNQIIAMDITSGTS